MSYHIPVMLNECVERLVHNPEGVYVDLTFGGGGHSREIVNALDGGKLFGFDQDIDARQNAEPFDKGVFTFVKANFRYFTKYLKLYGIKQVDGIMADLGVSSYQFDQPEKGFSTRFDGPLDMRMDRTEGITAADVLNRYEVRELHRILGMYGEVQNAKTLAAAIYAERVNAPFETIGGFKQLLSKYAKRGKENKYFAQVFQALRIEVNDEMKALEEMLLQCKSALKPEGRLVVLTYHSLEDRLVKNFINKGSLDGSQEKDFYGNLIRPFEPLFTKPIVASPEELSTNNRSRSAKLRVGIRK